MEIDLKETKVTYKGLKVLEASKKLPAVKNAGHNSFIFVEDVAFTTDFNFEIEHKYESGQKKYKRELVYILFDKAYKLVSIVKNDFTGLQSSFNLKGLRPL